MEILINLSFRFCPTVSEEAITFSFKKYAESYSRQIKFQCCTNYLLNELKNANLCYLSANVSNDEFLIPKM
jgi:hypothetical protein